MKKSLAGYLKYFSAILFIAGLVFSGFFAFNLQAQEGETEFRAFGFAYGGQSVGEVSSTGLGYTSFSCSDEEPELYGACADTGYYGVVLHGDPSDTSTYGMLTGHAYSANYGWISFEQDDILGCEYGDNSPDPAPVSLQGDIDSFFASTDPVSIPLSGFAKVTLAEDTSAGWSGCVYFGDDLGADYSASLEMSDGEISLVGWAYADIGTFGWLVFDEESCAAVVDPEDVEFCGSFGVEFTPQTFGPNVANFKANGSTNPDPVEQGSSVTLEWRVNQEVDYCEASVVGAPGFNDVIVDEDGDSVVDAEASGWDANTNPAGPGPDSPGFNDYNIIIDEIFEETEFKITCYKDPDGQDSGEEPEDSDSETVTVEINEDTVDENIVGIFIDHGPLNVVDVTDFVIDELTTSGAGSLSYSVLSWGPATEIPEGGSISECSIGVTGTSGYGTGDVQSTVDLITFEDPLISNDSIPVNYENFVMDNVDEYTTNNLVQPIINYTLNCTYTDQFDQTQDLSVSESVTIRKLNTKPVVDLYAYYGGDDWGQGYTNNLTQFLTGELPTDPSTYLNAQFITIPIHLRWELVSGHASSCQGIVSPEWTTGAPMLNTDENDIDNFGDQLSFDQVNNSTLQSWNGSNLDTENGISDGFNVLGLSHFKIRCEGLDIFNDGAYDIDDYGFDLGECPVYLDCGDSSIPIFEEF